MLDLLEIIARLAFGLVVLYCMGIFLVIVVGGLLAYPLTLIASPFVALYGWITGRK